MKRPLANLDYISEKRFSSYYHQIAEIIRLDVNSILEIGIGNGAVSCLLRQFGYDVTTMDNWESLGADIKASLPDIPVENESFDVVVAFQVLEHIAYEDFARSIRQMHRVSKKYVLVSIPNAKAMIAGTLYVPRLANWHFALPLPFVRPSKKLSKYHKWEINKPGYPLERILDEYKQADFEIINHFRLPKFQYHHMFVLKKAEERHEA